MKSILSMTSNQYQELRGHLFPGDDKEAIAFALCGRRDGKYRHRIMVREILKIPHEACTVRERDQIQWPTSFLRPILDVAAKKHMAVVKFHSHPQGYNAFSPVDDKADKNLFFSVHSWVDGVQPHVSVIMLPNGVMFGRSIDPELAMKPLHCINVVGDELTFWFSDIDEDIPEFAFSHAQAFGADTFNKLNRLRIGVIGCSGTGSVVIEQIVRLGVGELVLIDPDITEDRNINRILNLTMADANSKTKKVFAHADAIKQIGLGTEVLPIDKDLAEPGVVELVAECDVVFGCMDGASGRHILNKLATYYTIPYFDVGVRLEADGKGGIDKVIGSTHYLQPGLSSLLSRRVYTDAQLRAENLKRDDPAQYKKQLEEKYIKGVAEKRLAVISVNMFYASLTVNEFLARLHTYRSEPNRSFASYMISLSDGIYDYRPEGEPCKTLSPHVGKGDCVPLLGLPYLRGISE